jgi:TM2 domain-containing membrane protein YozV
MNIIFVNHLAVPIFVCTFVVNSFLSNPKLNMEQQKVDMFMMVNNKYFPESQIPFIRQRLLATDENREGIIQSLQFKDPIIALILSIFIGELGIDRFYVGDTGLGIGKLLTCGGLGLWSIIDWFLIMGTTREKNFMRLMTVI